MLFSMAPACRFDPDRSSAKDSPAARHAAEAKARVAQKPNDPALLLELAAAYAEDHRTFDAADTYQLAIDQGAKTAQAYAGLAETYLELGYIPRMVEQLRQCMSIDRNDPDCLFALGSLFQADGSPDGLREARRTWRQILAAAPSYRRAATVKSMLEQADARLGPETEADARLGPHGGALQEGGDESADRAHAHAGDSESQSAAGGHGAASGAAQGSPETIPAHAARGVTEDQPVGDLNPFGEALRRAYEAVRKNDPPAAEKAFGEALAIRPEDPSALSGLAQALLAQEKVDEAVQAARRGIAADPKDPQARWTYGLVMLKAKRDLEGALSAWETLIKDEPEYANRLRLPEMVARLKEAVSQKKLHPKNGATP